MADKQKIVKRIGEIERKISDGEALLRSTNRGSGVGWFFVVVGLLMIFLLGDVFIVVGLLVIVASIWRLAKATKYRKEIEDGLREYRGRKAELQSKLMIKE